MWQVVRQDDNGIVTVVERGLDEPTANARVAMFEARAHKQMYWAEPELELDELADGVPATPQHHEHRGGTE